MSSHPHSTDDATVIDVALAGQPAFSSHRSRPLSGCVSPVVYSPFCTVEKVPAASPHMAAGTTLSQTPALSCFHTGGSLGGASAPSFLVR